MKDIEGSKMKMNEGKRTIIGGLCALLAVLTITSGCGEDEAVKPAAPAEETAGESAPATAAAASLEERVSAKCECGIPIYQCAECRYEAGVVRLDASLLKREDGGGLVRTQTVARTKVSAALPTTGEIALNENAAVHISPRIAGIIESVSVDIGARVKAAPQVRGG